MLTPRHPIDRARAGSLAALAIAACEASSPSLADPGLDLQIRAADAQIVRGGLGPDEGGPAVTALLRPQPEVSRGEGTVAIKGRLGPGGVALHLHAEGDDKHWIVLPGGFDFVVPDELLWDSVLEFSHAIATEQVDVSVQAADKRGRLGPVTRTQFAVRPDVPPARLLISLGWDAPVDLDLIVETPDGTRIGAKNINSYEPPDAGTVPPPDAWRQGGWLDRDTNKDCRLDLHNRENVVWVEADPPPGVYTVYVNLFAPCESSFVNFEAIAQLHGEVVQRGRSTLYAFDAREQPAVEDAPGLRLMEFEVP
ncbi:MAG: hypothetical protein B7733_11555 [Myxococcales bacterium FL481]|nr:MAG: hypothetical protein B7733_11555 [Myxococcales bacterium FL481]